MSNLTSRSAVLAALFAAAAQLAACGGNDNDTAAAPAPVATPAPAPAPAPTPAPTPTPTATTISPLKVLTYTLADQNGATPADAGQVSAPTTGGATLSLGAQGAIVLTVDTSNSGFVVTTPDYTVVNRYAGSVMMLCDATTTPGATTARYVAVAASVAEGGTAPVALTSAAELAGLRFFKLSDCAYQSGSGNQGQNTAAAADTLFLEFDGNGNATSNASEVNYSASQFSAMLAGGAPFAAYRFTIDGQPRTVIVERGRYDAADAASGFVKLWLPQ
jgi:hypothetical protein